MANYAVGDIQGCYEPLVRLLDKVNFDQNKDLLFCVGDLVNRGPESLKVLRLLKSLNNQCVTVLGNHDIHLLSMIYGIRKPRPNDTLRDILDAHDLSELSLWLRSKPLMVQSETTKTLLCHAGIYPWWSRSEAFAYSDEIQGVFCDEKKCIYLLEKIYSNSPSKWDNQYGEIRRHRFIINAFTRMRFCSPAGHLNLMESAYIGKSRKNRLPWFKIHNPHLNGYRVVFGHWSALGLLNTATHLCLDTGYVWGRHMTMVKLPEKPITKPVDKNCFTIASHHCV